MEQPLDSMDVQSVIHPLLATVRKRPLCFLSSLLSTVLLLLQVKVTGKKVVDGGVKRKSEGPSFILDTAHSGLFLSTCMRVG